MKGITTEMVHYYLLLLISLVVVVLIFVHFIGNEKDKSFLNLPSGVWVSLSSADTKTFILPPAIWFGKELKLNGAVDFGELYRGGEPTEFIFPTNNVYLESPTGADALLGFELTLFFNPQLSFLQKLTPIFKQDVTYKFKVSKPTQPTIGFYPLITDNFGTPKPSAPVKQDPSWSEIYYLDADKSFGRVNVTFFFDFNKFYIKGKKLKKQSLEERVNLSVDYATDLNTKFRNCFGGEGKERGTKSLKELIDSGICVKESKYKYRCSFLFNVAEKCCPSYVTIKPVIKMNLTKGDGSSWFETLDTSTISFLVVYYADVLRNEDYLFNNFDKIQNDLFYDEKNQNLGPVKDIFIYPCRAKVSNIDTLSIRDDENNRIDFDNCRGAKEYVNLSGGWYCKKDSVTGFYYIYNPYAFCKLEGYELPSAPKPVYLSGIIPVTNLTKKWKLPKLPIYIGPGWTPKEGWGIYLVRLPDIPHGEFIETSWYWAAYIIRRSREILSSGNLKKVIFPETKEIGDIKIKYEFH